MTNTEPYVRGLLYVVEPPMNDLATMFWHECPGCRDVHGYHVYMGEPGRGWTFNQNYEAPSFGPSMLVYPTRTSPRCHYFLTDGQIHYQEDCDHPMHGQTVPLPPWTGTFGYSDEG